MFLVFFRTRAAGARKALLRLLSHAVVGRGQVLFPCLLFALVSLFLVFTAAPSEPSLNRDPSRTLSPIWPARWEQPMMWKGLPSRLLCQSGVGHAHAGTWVVSVASTFATGERKSTTALQGSITLPRFDSMYPFVLQLCPSCGGFMWIEHYRYAARGARSH